jgi:TPR repeat protein
MAGARERLTFPIRLRQTAPGIREGLRMICRYLALLLVSWSAFAAAAELDPLIARAEKLLANGKFTEVVALLAPHSAEPTPEVAFELAMAHLNLALDGQPAREIDQDEIRLATEWAERARALGNASGTNLLYMIYGQGYGTPADSGRAIAYLREAVENGDAGARLNYAVMLYTGTPDVPRDRDLAAKYFLEIAQREKPVPLAVYFVGLIKFKGEAGQPKDMKGGMELMRMAAEQGVGEAQQDVGRNYESGWTVKPDLKQALKWYQKAADNGEPWSQWRIGMAYVNGEGRKPDPVRAVEHFQLAANAGSVDGMTSLAVMYATGEGVPQDFTRARELYEQAVDAGGAHALKNLAGMYVRGEGVQVDLVHAYVLVATAEKRGDREALEMRKAVEADLTPEQLAEAQRRLK